jgi:hypothetical protein
MYKKSFFNFLFISAFVIGLSFVVQQKVFAGACTYVGVSGDNWGTGSNWSGTCVG